MARERGDDAPGAATDPSARKTALRVAGLARRAQVDPAERLRFADRLGRLLSERLGAADGRIVAGYWPIRGEPDCRPLLTTLHAAGFGVVLPVVRGAGKPLAFRGWRTGDALVANAFGIPEPQGVERDAEPDILLVPCAVFDRAGRRIGFGHGYYDVTLADLRARRQIMPQRQIIAIALAFSCQEIEAAPAEPHDEPVDAVITERDVIVCTAIGKALDATALHR